MISLNYQTFKSPLAYLPHFDELSRLPTSRWRVIWLTYQMFTSPLVHLHAYYTFTILFAYLQHVYKSPRLLTKWRLWVISLTHHKTTSHLAYLSKEVYESPRLLTRRWRVISLINQTFTSHLANLSKDTDESSRLLSRRRFGVIMLSYQTFTSHLVYLLKGKDHLCIKLGSYDKSYPRKQ